MKIIFSLAVCALLAGTLSAQRANKQKGDATTPKAVTVQIIDIKGENIGTAVFSPASPGVRLQIDIRKMPPGQHGFHIHQKPVCSAEDEFNTAGLQFDPSGELYGNAEHRARSGPSSGDPHAAVNVGEDGTGHLTVVLPKLTFGDEDSSIFHNGGTAIVFHAAAKAIADGNGPTRIACGVISRPADKAAKQ